MEWRERDGVRWLEAELPGATAAFTCRLGGVSEGPFESLNLGILTGDRSESVLANRARAATALGIDPARVLMARQVHAAEVEWRSGPDPGRVYAAGVPSSTEADGQATGDRGAVPLVLVADCLPVALAGERGIAMIHCGWRGLAAGIVARGVQAIGAIAAAVGPGIGPCCYEVGEEVLAAFAGLGPGIAAGRMLDLPEVTRRLLAQAGVERVEVAGLCTSCNPGLFFSHRRDAGRTGRQGGFAWLRDGGP
jgi:YfiH family protein